MTDSITDFFEWIRNNKNLKTVNAECETFELVDVGMKCYGGDTAVYLKNRDLQERMRRGLTFIRQNTDLEIGR